MKFTIFTLFPEYFSSALKSSLIGKAIESKTFDLEIISLRPFGEGKWQVVDDRPFGGGPGMVLMPTVLEKAFLSLFESQNLNAEQSLKELEESVAIYRNSSQKNSSFYSGSALLERLDSKTIPGHLPMVVYLSPQGILHQSKVAKSFAQINHLVLICGHYEGIDERAIENFVHEELSVGDFILTGGEPAALIVLDSIARFIPGVVGLAESVEGDSFGESAELDSGFLKGPTFTRPKDWRTKTVPEVLLSGNHQEISKYRKKESTLRTTLRRPDLLVKK